MLVYRFIEQRPDSYESHRFIIIQKIGDELRPQPFVDIVAKIPQSAGSP